MAAAALALPLTVAAVAAPAAALPPLTELADWRGSYPPYGSTSYPASPAYAALDTAEASVAQSSGLVEITTTLQYGEGVAAGTGIVLGSAGLVVTNHHVVEGATEITVTVQTSGQEYDAEVLGYDAAKDVAVLQLDDASGLTTVTTDPGSLTTGDAVTAVGDAGGDGGSLTAAPGAVTDPHHPVTVQDETTGETVRLRNLIEVSSDVVPGDSGGALLDADGEVVGMNVAASSGGDDVTGYVIPIGRVLRVVDAVLDGDESGTVVAQHQPGDSVTVTWTDASGAAHQGTVTLASGPVA